MIEAPSNCDLVYASSLKSEIISDFKKGVDVEVDLSNTERMSLACVQVLIAAIAKAKSSSHSIKIIPSEAVLSMLDSLGLKDAVIIQE